MKRDDSVYVQHSLDAVSKVETWLSGQDEYSFNQEDLLQDGVIRQIEIIGEATQRISQALRKNPPHSLAGYCRDAR
jgi:uncharacterized protein with HEPN domain